MSQSPVPFDPELFACVLAGVTEAQGPEEQLVEACGCDLSRWLRYRAETAEARVAELQAGVRTYLATLRELATARIGATDAEHAAASQRAAEAFVSLERVAGEG